MSSETITINEDSSTHAKFGGLILSITNVDEQRPRTADVVVGRIGYPNVTRTLAAGGAILYETPDQGIFEIRLMSIHIGYRTPGNLPDTATVAITPVVPIGRLFAAVSDDDTSNDPFAPAEVEQIRKNLQAVRDAAAEREDLRPEQLDYIARKLDEMVQAAGRLGRKDWLNLAVGTLTNVVVGAAIGSDAAKFLFHSVGQALAWLLGGTLKLLP
jgi:hypothetical protein